MLAIIRSLFAPRLRERSAAGPAMSPVRCALPGRFSHSWPQQDEEAQGRATRLFRF